MNFCLLHHFFSLSPTLRELPTSKKKILLINLKFLKYEFPRASREPWSFESSLFIVHGIKHSQPGTHPLPHLHGFFPTLPVTLVSHFPTASKSQSKGAPISDYQTRPWFIVRLSKTALQVLCFQSTPATFLTYFPRELSLFSTQTLTGEEGRGVPQVRRNTFFD